MRILCTQRTQAMCPYQLCPPSCEAGEGERAAPPLSHCVGEGLGVRAKKRERLAHSEPTQCALISP
jgi:hypothetical protein